MQIMVITTSNLNHIFSVLLAREDPAAIWWSDNVQASNSGLCHRQFPSAGR